MTSPSRPIMRRRSSSLGRPPVSGTMGWEYRTKPVLVDCVADASDPAERGELSLEGGLLLLLLGDVAEDHDDTLDGGPLPSGAEE